MISAPLERRSVTLGVMSDFILRQPERESDRDNQLRMLCAVPVTTETVKVRGRRHSPV